MENSGQSVTLDDDQVRLLAAVERAGISSMSDGDLKRTQLTVKDEDLGTPAEILMAAALEFPFYLLKTRWQYRDIEAIPAPKIEEVDDMGNTVAVQRKARPIAWRRIINQEGIAALWRGWGCRVVHLALWRAATVTGWELLMYLPGDGIWASLLKFMLSMTASTLIFHPLQVIETRITAGMVGYPGRGMSGGLVRVLKDDDAMQGAVPSVLHTMLLGPVNLGYMSLFPSLVWGAVLYPLESRATRARLLGPLEKLTAMYGPRPQEAAAAAAATAAAAAAAGAQQESRGPRSRSNRKAAGGKEESAGWVASVVGAYREPGVVYYAAQAIAEGVSEPLCDSLANAGKEHYSLRVILNKVVVERLTSAVSLALLRVLIAHLQEDE